MLYPIMTETRSLYDLGGVWNFKLDDGTGWDESWQASKLTDTIPMAVPSAYNDLGVSPEIRNHVGWVWYERELTLPANILNERLVLRFGSATHKAKVFINGSLVMEHAAASFPSRA